MKKSTTNRRILTMVFGPVLLGCLISLAFSMTFRDTIPRNLNVTEWKTFSVSVENDLSVQNKYYGALILMMVHFVQTYCCLPMEHITKIFYGYWLGFWPGLTICVGWELFLNFVYIQHVDRIYHHDIQQYISQKRAKGHLIWEIAFCCVSNLPIYTKGLLVSFSDISRREFMCGCCIPTVIMSLKNVSVGSVLASNPSTRTIVILISIISFSLIIPTISAIFFSSGVLMMLRSASVVEARCEDSEVPLIHKEEDSSHSPVEYFSTVHIDAIPTNAEGLETISEPLSQTDVSCEDIDADTDSYDIVNTEITSKKKTSLEEAAAEDINHTSGHDYEKTSFMSYYTKSSALV